MHTSAKCQYKNKNLPTFGIPTKLWLVFLLKLHKKEISFLKSMIDLLI